MAIGGLDALIKFVGGSIDGQSIDGFQLQITNATILETFNVDYDMAEGHEIKILGSELPKFTMQ